MATLSTTSSESSNRIGLFSWKYVDLQELTLMCEYCDELNVTEVYQYISSSTFTDSTSANELSTLIYNLKNSTKNNVEIVYLCGDSSWYSEPSSIKKRIDYIVSFNNNNLKNVKINKIILDIEPWTSATSDVNWATTYQSTMTEVYTYCQSKNIQLMLCVPFWLDTASSIPSTEFYKSVIDFCDDYVVMNYNKNVYLTAMDNEVSYAQQTGKYICSVAECQEPNDEYGVTENLTYFNDGLDVLQTNWNNLKTKYNYDKLYFAYHDMTAMKSLLNIKKIIQNIKIGQSNVKIMYGEQAISKIYIGNTLIYLSTEPDTPETPEATNLYYQSEEKTYNSTSSGYNLTWSTDCNILFNSISEMAKEREQSSGDFTLDLVEGKTYKLKATYVSGEMSSSTGKPNYHIYLKDSATSTKYCEISLSNGQNAEGTFTASTSETLTAAKMYVYVYTGTLYTNLVYNITLTEV